jgi:hypothetical protein
VYFADYFQKLDVYFARALLELSGRKLPISPWFVYRMGGGATVAAIIAAHIKKREAGGACMVGRPAWRQHHHGKDRRAARDGDILWRTTLTG